MCKKRILIIDNDVAHLKSTHHILQADGYEVFSHAKAYSATEIAQQLQPDLILLDVNRPDLTGEKVFAILRATDSTRDIPVIFCSSNGEEGLRASAKRFGAHGYLVKGSAALLRHCVARVVGKETPPPERETSPWTAEGGGTW